MKVITIGRDKSNDIVIADDPHASRHHLQIIQHDDGHFSLKDFGSTNGTTVNGNRIYGEIPLNEMDVVRIGSGNPIPWRDYFYSDVQYSYSSPHYRASNAAARVTLSGEEEPPLKKGLLTTFCIIALLMGVITVFRIIVYYWELPILGSMIVSWLLEGFLFICGLTLIVLAIIILRKSSTNMIA